MHSDANLVGWCSCYTGAANPVALATDQQIKGPRADLKFRAQLFFQPTSVCRLPHHVTFTLNLIGANVRRHIHVGARGKEILREIHVVLLYFILPRVNAQSQMKQWLPREAER